MATKKRTREISNIIAVQARPDGLYVVNTSYEESDALHAVGQLWRSDWDPTGGFNTVLNTNDTLANLWISSTDQIWVGSSRGNVWTTASVRWPAHREKDLDWSPEGSGLDWEVTTLPDHQKHGYVPNITALWGAADDSVYAGTFKGTIYHWNGHKWIENETGVDSGINGIHGTGPTTVFAVGDRGVILHFDGKRWKRLPYPADCGEDDALTGVRMVSPGEAFISGRQGRVLHGGPAGFEILAETRFKFYGLARLRGRIILAAGNDGVAELKRNRVTILRDTFAAAGVFETGNTLAFVEPAQPDGPCMITYDPARDEPWLGKDFF